MKRLTRLSVVGLVIVVFAACSAVAQPPPTMKREGLEMQGATAEDVVGDWEIVWSAAPDDDLLCDGDVRYAYFAFRADGQVFRVGTQATDTPKTAGQLERLAASVPAARYSFNVAGMMVLELGDAKRQVWMITKVIEAPPDKNIRPGDLSFGVMARGFPTNFHILRRLPRD